MDLIKCGPPSTRQVSDCMDRPLDVSQRDRENDNTTQWDEEELSLRHPPAPGSVSDSGPAHHQREATARLGWAVSACPSGLSLFKSHLIKVNSPK